MPTNNENIAVLWQGKSWTVLDKILKQMNNDIAEVAAQVNTGLNALVASQFAAARTGKVFTTKFPRYEISTSPTGIKMDDNEGMVCIPSTPTSKNTNDYESEPMFQILECNWELNNAGNINITAIKGLNSEFARDGSNGQVGIINMPWFVKSWEDENYWYISVSDTQYAGYQPLGECIKPDGSLQGFMVHAKYAMVEIDGKPYSASGRRPCAGGQQPTNVFHVEGGSDVTEKPTIVAPSYSGLINYCHKHSNFYCAETSNDMFFMQLQYMIKYATLNSQGVLNGCFSYNYSYKCTVAEKKTRGIIIATSNANNLVVGSTCSIGTVSGDKYYATQNDILYSRRISKIEQYDASNSKVWFETDLPAGYSFDTDTTYYLITMPWYTGSCDNVLGMDGSAGNPTNGKYPALIGGMEYFVGGYETLGNVVMDIQTTEGSTVRRDVYIAHDATVLSTDMTTVKAKFKKSKYTIPGGTNSWRWITKCGVDLDNGIMVPIDFGASSNTGFCDGVYTDAGTSGQREWLAFGGLSASSCFGAWGLSANHGLGDTHWHFLSRISPNGMYGNLA